MKKRQGWVSNSSSSSFICDVCGCVGSGYDASASDFDMSYFDCGHLVCNDEFSIDISKLSIKQKRKLVEDGESYNLLDEKTKELFPEEEAHYYWDLNDNKKKQVLDAVEEVFKNTAYSYYDDIDYEEIIQEYDEIPAMFCPVCNLSHISDELVLRYIVNTENISIEQIKGTIRDNFKTLDDLTKTFK